MLEVKNLRKTFGELVAVDDLSFTIEDGEILGFIGQMDREKQQHLD